ncbi:MAG: MFS transporter [Fibrobacteres bacterium]|jgi:MFS family permease|nr:MFS transporter [Fibrobacterota bacterium]
MLDPSTDSSLREPPSKHAGHLAHPARLLEKLRDNLLELVRAPNSNTRFLIVSGGLWTMMLAATDPYKTLFFQRLGFDNKAIGWLLAMDMVVRAAGLGLSGFFMRRFGAKRMLVGGDIISWVVPYLILGLASQPWHVVVAVLCTSLNAFASTPYNCLLVQGMPPARRTKAYAFMHLWNIAPTVVVPWIAGQFVASGEFLPAVRILFLLQAASMSVGIFLRWRKLEDLEAIPPERRQGFLATLVWLIRSKPFLAAWMALSSQWVVGQIWNSFLPIFLTKHLGEGVKMPALMNEATGIGILVGSLVVIPRLSESRMRHLAPVGLLVQTFFVLLYPLNPSTWGLLALAGMGGICSSLYLGATSAILAHALPAHLRDHGFSISYIGAFLLSAATMPWVGSILNTHLGAFPFLAGAGLLAWMGTLAISDRLLKRAGI